VIAEDGVAHHVDPDSLRGVAERVQKNLRQTRKKVDREWIESTQKRRTDAGQLKNEGEIAVEEGADEAHLRVRGDPDEIGVDAEWRRRMFFSTKRTCARARGPTDD